MQQDSDSYEASGERIIISGGSRTSSVLLSRPSNENIFSGRSRKSSDPLCTIPIELARRLAIARWAPIPLRLIVGYGFLAHGLAKLSRGPGSFAAILHAIGVPAPHFMAKLFGYPTFWVNRLKLPAEELGAVPDASGNSLTHLVQFLA